MNSSETECSNTSVATFDIPGYEILEEIGEGGMGRVYKAIQLNLRRPVAIKRLNAIPTGQAVSCFQQRMSADGVARPSSCRGRLR